MYQANASARESLIGVSRKKPLTFIAILFDGELTTWINFAVSKRINFVLSFTNQFQEMRIGFMGNRFLSFVEDTTS